MRGVIFILSFLLVFVCFPVSVFALSPSPDIKVNGFDNNMAIASGEELSITLALDTGDFANQDADWWFLHYMPDGSIYYFDILTWELRDLGVDPVVQPTYQGPLFDFGALELVALSDLSEGAHEFLFAVDTERDGVLQENAFSDSVTVTVTSDTVTSEDVDLSGNYTYETFNPELSGSCDLITLFLGCTSDCTIIGTDGEMNVTQRGDNIAIEVKGSESPEWYTFEGAMNNDGFTSEYSTFESMSGCDMTADIILVGDNIDTDSFSGYISGDLDMSGNCFGMTLDCLLSADYTAKRIQSGSLVIKSNSPEGESMLMDSLLRSLLSR